MPDNPHNIFVIFHYPVEDATIVGIVVVSEGLYV
jgi:hypothetical protein